MSDLVERLRDQACKDETPNALFGCALMDAADEIIRLRVELESVRADAQRYRRLLLGCKSAMRTSQQRPGLRTDWSHMIAAIDAAMGAKP